MKNFKMKSWNEKLSSCAPFLSRGRQQARAKAEESSTEVTFAKEKSWKVPLPQFRDPRPPEHFQDQAKNGKVYHSNKVQ